jgi:hypothetical protein
LAIFVTTYCITLWNVFHYMGSFPITVVLLNVRIVIRPTFQTGANRGSIKYWVGWYWL